DAAMQRERFRRLAARHRAAVRVDLRDVGRIEAAEARVGRRDQPAVVEPRADVAGTADRIAALIETRANRADFFAHARFGGRLKCGRVTHRAAPSRWRSALSKKSVVPKLPDFSASA